MNKLFEKKIEELKTEIETAAQKYYTDGTSDLSDAEFDAKVDELRKLDPENPVVNETGWGYAVDEDTTPGQKVPHKYGPAGSLDKIRTGDEFKKAFNIKPNDPSAQYTASLKLDGISVVLYYEHGHLVRALTRGDGKIGIDITDKVNIINTDLEDIEATWFTGAVRGEIVMSYVKFKKLIEFYPELKNPRNATAGIINRKDLSYELNYLNILVYSVVGWKLSPNIDPFENDDSMWKFLEDQFFYTAPRESYKCLTSSNLDEEMDDLQRRWYGKYPADGIVITKQMKLDQLPYITYESVAYKFPSEIKETTVVDVEWNMSKTGYIIPRVKVEPVELAGTTVQYATGFNAQYIKDNFINKGAKVQITKRGEIIPYIVCVTDAAYYCTIPMECPECHEPLTWNGVHLQCMNKECPNIHHQDLAAWLDAFAPVDGLQDTLRTKYMEQLFGKSDLTVDDVMSTLMQMFDDEERFDLNEEGHEGLLKKMFDQLWDREKKYSISTALQALNIPRFGDKTCDKFAEDPVKALIILNAFYDAPYPDEIPGTIRSDSYAAYSDCVAYIGVANTAALWEQRYKIKLLVRYMWDRIEWNITKPQYKGKVAITGKLSCKRADFEKELKAAGYQPGEIAKDTMFLVTDAPNSSSSKNQKADAWGITKITETEFRQKYMRE